MPEKQIEVLENLAVAKNYRNWCVSLAISIAGSKPFELGSGLGHYAEEIVSSKDFKIDRMTLSEIDKTSLIALKRKFLSDRRIDVINLGDRETPIENDHTSFLSWNVLEHIEDDVSAMRIATQVCAPGSNVMIFVPAYRFLYSHFDKEIGHHRRYTKRELINKATLAGFHDIQVRSFNFGGFFYWFFVVKLLRRTPKESLTLKLLDRFFVPIARNLESRTVVPAGQSLVLFAKTNTKGVKEFDF